jgi:hypothetical protein
MTLEHIILTLTLDTILASDAIVVFVIPLVALQTSSHLICEEQLWNFIVL